MTKASASKPVPIKRLNQEQTDCFNAIYCREKNMAFKRASSEIKKITHKNESSSSVMIN